MDREKKIAYLVRYSQIKQRMMILIERKKAYESDVYGIKSPIISDMPKGSRKTDLSDKVIKLLTLTSDIDKEVNVLGDKLEKIKAKIQSLEDYKLMSVLEMKYVDGMQRKQMLSILNCSMSTLERMTNEAIEKLNLNANDFNDVL